MTNLRRVFSMTLLSLMVLAAVGIGMAMAGEDIRLAFTPPITGASAAEGSFQIKAIKLALKEINAAGGVNGKKIDLRMVDNQSTNPGALAALQRAVEQDKPLALIGFVKSTQVLATSDAIKNYGIPTFIGGTNATLTRQGNPWLFRVRPDDSIAALAMVMEGIMAWASKNATNFRREMSASYVIAVRSPLTSASSQARRATGSS